MHQKIRRCEHDRTDGPTVNKAVKKRAILTASAAMNYAACKILSILDVIPKPKFKHPDITIISNNCLSGFLYRDLRVRYNAPTIGLQFTQHGFVRFCRNLDSYLQLDLVQSFANHEKEFQSLGGRKIDFPVALLGSDTLFLQHYKSFAAAATAWNRRKQRINLNKLFFVFMVYDNTSESVVREFEALPYKNKLTIGLNRSFGGTSYNLKCGCKHWYSGDLPWHSRVYWRFNFRRWFEESLVRQE